MSRCSQGSGLYMGWIDTTNYVVEQVAASEMSPAYASALKNKAFARWRDHEETCPTCSKRRVELHKLALREVEHG